MSTRVPSSPRPDPANEPTYVWSQIDPRTNRLIRDKLRKATSNFRQEIDRETARIRLQNRLNLNKTGVDQQIARMWAAKIQAHVEMCYDKIYCHHWSLLGHRKTGAFVRACSAILGNYINTLGNGKAHKARIDHLRQGGIRQSLEGLYKSSTASLRKELEEHLDIEARELDLVASVERAEKRAHVVLPSTEQRWNPHAVTSRVDLGAVANPGEIVVESGSLSEHADTAAVRIFIHSSAPLSTFETTVGELMVQARKVCPTKYLPQTEISTIAGLLDSKNIPVRDNLEREAARAMAEYNQRNPRVAIKTWRAAASHRQFRRSVRKRFSRAEEKYKKAAPALAGLSAGTLRTTI